MTERGEVGVRLPRDKQGQFFSRNCIDPKCDGHLVPEGMSGWHCNGMTHRGKPEDGYPLEACRYWHTDGDVRTAP